MARRARERAGRPDAVPMGFQKSASDQSPPDKMRLEVINYKEFKLLTPFTYVAEDGEVVNVPAHDPNDKHSTTDLASVPTLLWGLLPSYGRQLRAALMHDHLCDAVNRYPPEQRKTAAAKRRRADKLFREAMRNPLVGTSVDPQIRVPWFRSWLFWAGVSFGRIWKFHKVGGLLLTIHVLVGLLASYVVVRILPMAWAEHVVPFALGDNWLTYATIYLISLVLSFAWVGNARVPLIGHLIGPVVVPVFIVTFIAQFVTGLPDAVNRRFRKDKEPKANLGPVIVARQDP